MLSEVFTTLTAIRALFADGKTEEALSQVDNLIRTTDHPDAHLLRIDLLTRTWTRIDALSESLRRVQRSNQRADDHEPILTALRRRVDTEINRAEAEIARDNPSFGRMESLSLLAGAFPSIYTLLAQVHLLIHVELSKDSGMRTSKLRRSLDMYLLERHGSAKIEKPLMDEEKLFPSEDDFEFDDESPASTPSKANVSVFTPDTEKAYINAKIALEQAMQRLAPADPYYAQAVALMATWHERGGDLDNAVSEYERAYSLGADVYSRYTSARLRFAEQTHDELIRVIDSLLMRENTQVDFPALESLFAAGAPFETTIEIILRRGDLALIKNDLVLAERFYRTVINAPTGSMTSLFESVSIEALRMIRQFTEAHPVMPKPSLLLRAVSEAARPTPRRGDPLWLAFQLGTPNADPRKRAAGGLVTVYQRQGEVERAAAILRDLLTDPALPRDVAHEIAAAFEDNERLTNVNLHTRAVGVARAMAQVGDWSGAARAFYQVCGLSETTGLDSAWLALCIWRAGDDIRDAAQILTRVTASDFAELPVSHALDLLAVLRIDGFFALTERLLPALDAPDEWLSTHRMAIQDYTAQRRAAVDLALAESRWETAIREARLALDATPDDAALMLRLARALVGAEDLVGARRALYALEAQPAFANDASLREGAALIQIDIDLARGYTDEARRRLTVLEQSVKSDGDSLSTALRYTLKNRIERLPAFKVGAADSTVAEDSIRRVPAAVHYALFAARLTSVRAARDLPSVDDACARFLKAISSRAGELPTGFPTHFSWRFIGRDGRLTLALIARVEAQTSDAALGGARALWRLLENALPLQNDVFAFEPVYSESALDDLLTPCAIDSAVEIARRELTVTMPTGEPAYVVYPFALWRGDLRRALTLMIQQPRTTVLDIHLMPTTMFAWERTAITGMMRLWEQTQLRAAFAQQIPVDDLPQLLEIERTKSMEDFRQSMVGSLYPDFLNRTGSLAFVGQITLAAQGALDPALPDIVSMDWFGTSIYDILPALSQAEIDTVRRNLAEVQCERWLYSAAPGSVPRWRHLLTPDEALTASRLPTPDASGIPGVPSLKLRAITMPDAFPAEGIVVGEGIFPVNGQVVQVKSNIADRLRHVYMVGRTGTGKSTLIQNMALQDIEAGRGVGVIDPHGDLFDAILQRIPPHRVQDVVVFDPSDAERPVALNIIDVEGDFEKNMVIADFLGLLYSLFDPGHTGIIGPRFENVVRHSMLAVMESMEGATLMEVVRMITDKDFRDSIIKMVKDPLVKNYWDNVGHNLDNFGWGSAKGEMVDWVASKFGRFVDDHIMRPIIGQSKNTMDFESIMNEGKILLVDLSKGKLGPECSKFIGLLLVPRLLIAAHRRTRLPAHERRPFCLYVDEFQNFTTPAFAEMLSEARKYGVALTVANQFTSQLDPYIRESVFGNVGTMLVFQVGIRDAALLSPEMYPATSDDIINLPNYHLLAKMLIDSNVSTPFPVRTLPDTRIPNADVARAIRASSRQRYGRDAALIKHEIAQRFYKPPKAKSAGGGLDWLNKIGS